jgi:hypothetical protein
MRNCNHFESLGVPLNPTRRAKKNYYTNPQHITLRIFPVFLDTAFYHAVTNILQYFQQN